MSASSSNLPDSLTLLKATHVFCLQVQVSGNTGLGEDPDELFLSYVTSSQLDCLSQRAFEMLLKPPYESQPTVPGELASAAPLRYSFWLHLWGNWHWLVNLLGLPLSSPFFKVLSAHLLAICSVESVQGNCLLKSKEKMHPWRPKTNSFRMGVVFGNLIRWKGDR